MAKVLQVIPDVVIPESELRFRFSRSGGPGGQNVNKVETKVELVFDVVHSASLNDVQKQRILASAASRVDEAGVLHIVARESRSQWKNRQEVVRRFVELLRRAFQRHKSRVATKPTRAGSERRIQAKKGRGEKKRLRGRVVSEY